MWYSLATIAVLTLIFWIAYKKHIVKFCPICAAVVITWTAGIIGLVWEAGWANPLIVAILMGASLGALADRYGSRFGLIWKTGIILLGLPAIYFAIEREFLNTVVALIGMIFLTLILRKSGTIKAPNEDKDLFNNCC